MECAADFLEKDVEQFQQPIITLMLCVVCRDTFSGAKKSAMKEMWETIRDWDKLVGTLCGTELNEKIIVGLLPTVPHQSADTLSSVETKR